MNINNNHNISIDNHKNLQKHKNNEKHKNNKNTNIIWADEVGLTQTQEDVSDIEADWKEFLHNNRMFLNEEEIKQLNAQFEYNEK
jgi:hypothetical protein